MRALDLADLVVIAGQVLGIDPGAALAQVDLDAARAAPAAAKPPQPELTEAAVRAAIIAVAGDPGPGRPAHHRRHKPGPRDDEIRRLRAEVARLADLLRENGIEPGDGGRQTA